MISSEVEFDDAQIVPTRWYSWDVKVADESRPVADIAMSWWREKGALAIDGATYRVYREAPMSGAFVHEGAGGVLAWAEKPSVLRREFVILARDSCVHG